MEFEPVEGLNQIVGHTRDITIREKTTQNSRNYCVDTHLNHVVLVNDDGTIAIEPVEIDVQYQAIPVVSSKLFNIESSYDDGATWNKCEINIPDWNLQDQLNALLAKNNKAIIVNTLGY